MLVRRLKDRRGAALILAICVMAVFAALGLSLLLSAAGLIKNAQEDYRNEQLRIAASTLSRTVEVNLDGKDALNADSGSLCRYLYQQMRVFGGSWDYYNEDESGRYLNSLMYTTEVTLPDSFEDILSGATLSLYWKSESAVMNNPSVALRDKYGSVTLVVIARCVSAEGKSYEVQSAYGLSYGEAADGSSIVTWYAKGTEQ